MKPRTPHDLTEKVLTRATQLALLAMFAMPGLAAAQDDAAAAQDPAAKEKAAHDLAVQAVTANGEGDVKDLICPTNYFEVGAMYVPKTAPKFGEYNGLSHSGGYGVANFSVSGGDGYCQSGGTMRWDVYGTNLGTTSRNLGLDAGQQGQWSIGLNFDQIRHYTTTGYQTPYQGSQGGNVFVLPSSFGVINTGVNGGTQTLTPAQLAAMHTANLYSERQNTSFSASYAINTEWNAKFDYKHIERSGAKLIGGATDAADMTGLGGFSFSGQDPSLKMNPTKDSTDMITLGLNWVGQKAYATFEYYGSLYHDDYSGVSFSNPFVTGTPATGALSPTGLPLSTMSTPPNNMLNQLNFSGGYFFSQKTRLTGGLSLGLNTQNASYDGTYTPGTVAALPTSSLHGRVINTHADARLTHQFTPALNLNTGFRYDERNNTTPVNTYSFTNIAGTSGIMPVNAPESYRHTVFDAGLDYRIDKSQKLHLGYGYDHMQRWCNSWLANNAQGSLPAGAAGYYVTNSCVQVPESTDNSLNVSYKRTAFDDSVNFTFGYAFADRDDKINPSFYNPMQSMTNGQGYENYGWLAYFQAPRREHTLKARADWQINDQFDVGITGNFILDSYYDSTLGVQSGHAGNINLDANYQISDNASFGAYLSFQHNSRQLLSSSQRSPTVAPTQLWDNTLSDNDFAVGLNAKQKLLGGKLSFSEDLSYDLGKSRYETELFSTPAALGNAGQVPDIKSEIVQLRLVGSYDMSKTSRLSFGYLFQRLISNDYLYNAYMYGFTSSTVLPANLNKPSYTINTVFISYRHTF